MPIGRPLAKILAAAAILLPASLVHAQSSPSAFTWATRYDSERRVVGTISPDPDGSGSLAYAAVRNTYDANGRLVKVELGELSGWQSEAVAPASWSGFSVFQTADTTYDADGRKLVETMSSGALVITRKQWSWNPGDQPVCETVRMNAASNFAAAPADACTLGTAGSEGPDRITHTTYDSVGRVASVQKAWGTSLQQNYVAYTYTLNDKQATVTDANGTTAAYAYDSLDRLQRWYFASKTTAGVASTTDYEEYGYDTRGNRTGFRKRDGRLLTFTYDALNRVISKIVPDGCAPIQVGACPASAATRDLYYGYDNRGLQLYARYDSASGEGLTNVYDSLGRLSSATNTMGGVTRTIGSLYNADGGRTRITHPDGAYFENSHDGLDRVAGASWWIAATGTVPFFGITYDQRGLRWGTSRASSSTWRGFDGAARVIGMSQYFAGGTGNLTTSQSFNAASQITSQTRDNDSYVFSGTVSASRTYTVNGLNQYTAAGSASFTYDANGNLITDGTNSYTYDAENRLVAGGAYGATLTYDPLGRLWQVASGTYGSTQFVYEGDEVSLEYNGATGGILRRFFWGPNADEPIMDDEGGALDCSGSRFLHDDPQGSIVAVADCWGNRTNVDAYDDWGIPNANNWGRYQYTGQAWIPDLGMYYYKARIYSPTLGRFLQTDPIGYKDQVNLYAYVGNDPIDGRDPTGTKCETKEGKLVCHFVVVTPAGQRSLTPGQQAAVKRFERNYIRTIEKAAAANRNVQVGKTSGRDGTSFSITGSQLSASLKARDVTIDVGGKYRNALLVSGGDADVGRVGTTVFGSELNRSDREQQEDVAHEGIHSSPQEKMGNALAPLLGLEPYSSGHQQSYNNAAEELIPR